MSVDILFCEGGQNKIDNRVLSMVLDGLCQIKPVGSKYGFKEKVLLNRELKPETSVAGLRDRDFDEDESTPTESLRQWTVQDNQNNILIGWYWERKEIENYIIDPNLVIPALDKKAPEKSDYINSLENAALTIANYTAARTALSLSRVQLLPLQNYWGSKKYNIKFPFNLNLDEPDCRSNINDILQQYSETQIPKETDVISHFEKFLISCQSGGCRFDNQNYLTFFSGKDLLCAMEEDLLSFGLGTPADFRERVLKGMKTLNEVWQYIPEWQNLRNLIRTTNFFA